MKPRKQSPSPPRQTWTLVLAGLAAFMTALALVAGDLITKEQAATLMRPMAEALPWLLPEEGQPGPEDAAS